MNGSKCKPTFEKPFLVECIRGWYQVQVASIQCLPSDSGKHIYRVNLANGESWVLRIVEDQDKATLKELTDLLQFFEQQNYHAERIILSVEQTTTVAINNWHLLMTTFVVGTRLEYTPNTFLSFGASLGRLHTLKSSFTYMPPQAHMLPTGELAFAQQQLGSITALVPSQYIAQYDLLEKSLLSIDRGIDLPTTPIHNDCHPVNALLTVAGQVTLLDWEGAGMGPAVIDVGFLLENCDGKAPWDPLSTGSFQPNKELVRAVVEGYCQYYQLTTEELNYLPDAMRFRSLVYGVCSFAAAIAQKRSADFSQWWWNRYCAADEIAELARIHFEDIL